MLRSYKCKHKGAKCLGVTLSVALASLTIVSGFLLASSAVSADDTVVDDVNITVPIACTMTGTGTDTHNATISPGTSNSNIGTTTIKAFCNDNDGFSIYAIGYTSNTDGNNTMTSTTLNPAQTIATGTATSGDSQWAMKLATTTSPTPTYPITIQNSFDSFHTVPDDYTLAAKRTAATDVGTNAIGSELTSTYQVYISTSQAADTYTGKVKYVMVHPNYVDDSAVRDAVTVVFDGNGLTFPDSSTTNTVRYTKVRDQGSYAYVSDTAGGISKTPNVNSDGTQGGSIIADDSYSDSVTIPGADKLKVVLRYDIDPSNTTSENANAFVNISDNYSLYSDYYGNGTETITAEGDTVYFYYSSWGNIDENHDYGYYAEVYAAYDTEQPGTTSEILPSNNYSMMAISGNYVEPATTEWRDRWETTIDGYDHSFNRDEYCESDWCFNEENNNARGALMNYINDNYDELKGTELNIRAFNPVTFDEVYAANNKTKVNGYYTIQDLDASMCSSVTNEEVATVIDIRDNNIYGIAKLPSVVGECWLRDDLKLDPTNPTTAANMSAANTNATDEAIANYLNGGNPNGNEGWSSVAVVESNENSYTEPKINKSAQSDQRGVAYNFCAISVGTYCRDHYNGAASTSYDLCPAGWSLPDPQRSGNGIGAYWYSKILSLKFPLLAYWNSSVTSTSSLLTHRYKAITSYGTGLILQLDDGVTILNEQSEARCLIYPSNN